MKRLLILFALLLMPVAMVNAQDALEPDTVIRGEITDEVYEVEYTFSGAADSIIVIEMLAEDEDGLSTDLTSQIVILDSEGSVVIDTSDNFVFGDATLVTKLPADDDYTIIASREDGQAGETTGLYSIQLIVPEILRVGDKVESSVTSETEPKYFVIDAKEDYVLRYTKNAGDYDPEINISTIADNNSDFEDYALASGQLDNIALGNIEAGVYVVRVQDAFFSFSFTEVTADFNLSVDPIE